MKSGVVPQNTGQYTWNITHPSLLNKIINAKNGEEFQSHDFEMANLGWKMEIYPNGRIQDRLGSFDAYLRLCQYPSPWRDILIAYTLECVQTKSRVANIQIYKDKAMSWGWSEFSMTLQEVKQLNDIAFCVTVKIIRVILHNNTVHYQSSFQYKTKQKIKCHINSETLRLLKRDHYGKRWTSPIENQMFAIYVCPNGGAAKAEAGKWYIGIRLCVLPDNIDKMKIQWTLNIDQSGFQGIKAADITINNNSDYMQVGSYADFKSLSDFTVNVDLQIIIQYDGRGKEVALPGLLNIEYITQINDLYAANQHQNAYSKLKTCRDDIDDILQEMESEQKQGDDPNDTVTTVNTEENEESEAIIQSLTEQISIQHASIQSLQNENSSIAKQLSTTELENTRCQQEINTLKQQQKMEMEQHRNIIKSVQQQNSSQSREIKDFKHQCQQYQNQIQSLQSQLLQNTQKTANEISDKAQEIEAQKAIIMALQNEINALKQQQNEEEKKQDEDQNIDLKQDLISMTNSMNTFNTKYNKEIISNIHNNNPDALSINKELDEADISCKSMSKKLQDIKGYIDEFMRIDLTAYKSWDMDTTMKWIKSLDEGRFVKYMDVLRAGFESDKITAADLPDIGQSDLRIKPFEITEFGDRKKLAQHFKSLSSNQHQGQTNNNENEGVMTEYH